MNIPKRILIACGGTGGHLAPGIALAQRLQSRGDSCQLLISSKQVDKRLIQNYPELNFHGLGASALKKGPLGAIQTLWTHFLSLLQCLKLISQQRPTAVIGFGGFTTFSAGIAAWLSGTPLLLHESNHRAGRVVRYLARFAKKVYLPHGTVSIPRSISEKKVSYANNPLRTDLKRLNKDEARLALGLPVRGKLLFVTGGSQGAHSINQWALEHEDKLLKAGIHLYCLTGPLNDMDHTKQVNLPLGQVAKSVFEKFSDKMHLLYTAADLVIARAGAGTINELIAFERPSILIPYPFAADDHQKANAAYVERNGGCVIVEQTNLDNLFKEASHILKSSTLAEALSENLQKMQTEDPCKVIIDDIRLLRTQRIATKETPNDQTNRWEDRFLALLQKENSELTQQRLLRDEPIGPKTTFGIGGNARYYIEPESKEELAFFYKIAHKSKTPVFFLGRGSNLLVLSSGFHGLVIRLSHSYWQKIELLSEHRVYAGAGVRLKALAGQMARQGLSGFEFMEGIPATVGGGVRTNPGAFKGWFYERVHSIEMLAPSGKIVKKSPKAFKTGYRKVFGYEDHIALGVTFEAKEEMPAEEIKKIMESYQAHRRKTQPREPSAGSVFKNPEGTFAGKLIEQTQLKGLTIGGAAISTQHANFIINKNNATPEDVINLINTVRQKVYKSKKIALEPEIMLLGGRWNDYLISLEV